LEGKVRVFQFIAVTWLALACAPTAANAEKRIALIIGNSSYQNVGRLPNPVNDAAAMAALFKSAGFEVAGPRSDLGIAAMRRAIGDFADVARDSDIAVIYFAGHGIEVDGVNYLIPVDAVLARDFDVEDETVSLDRALKAIESARRLRLVILDACRSNPFVASMKRSSRAIGRGFTRIEPSPDTLVAYAAKAGSTAADGSGEHSPFTGALLKHLATPGLDIRLALGRVRDAVRESTSPRQEPFVYGDLGGRTIAIVEGVGGDTVPQLAANAADATVARAWTLVEHSTSLAVIDEFIRQYGDTPIYGALAQKRRAELAQQTPPARPQPQVAMADTPPRRDGMPLTAAQERGLQRGNTFRECADCPEMVVLPAGSFTMGSPAEERDRQYNEGPQHVVNIGRPFAVGKFHATRDQFAAFVQATGRDMSNRSCSWRSPEFEQEGSHPVVCVSWDDAKAYAEWVATKTGKPYRLLSEAEWEYAARGRMSPGAYPRFWFGDNGRDLCRYGNGWDQAASTRGAPCDDGYHYTSPAGHYEPNVFGLYDMLGNAWQWTADCYHDNYNGAPADGSLWTTNKCDGQRVARGGSWASGLGDLRSAFRDRFFFGNNGIGFRLARTLTP
jgi:formylglycine-generating enzyme required for sulfatase activity